MGKSIRFAELVKHSGRPEVATLWQDPENDPEFKKAIRENRVLTVRQETVGNKKDFGEVGFQKARNVSYLIFPKPLPNAEEARVVGIKYDEVESRLAPASKKSQPVPATKRKSLRQAPPAPPTPPEKRKDIFSVIVKKTAVWETTIKIEASSKASAEEQAAKIVEDKEMPLSEAKVTTKIQKTTRS